MTRLQTVRVGQLEGAVRLIRQHGLTLAEVTALRTALRNDYLWPLIVAAMPTEDHDTSAFRRVPIIGEACSGVYHEEKG